MPFGSVLFNARLTVSYYKLLPEFIIILPANSNFSLLKSFSMHLFNSLDNMIKNLLNGSLNFLFATSLVYLYYQAAEPITLYFSIIKLYWFVSWLAGTTQRFVSWRQNFRKAKRVVIRCKMWYKKAIRRDPFIWNFPG